MKFSGPSSLSSNTFFDVLYFIKEDEILSFFKLFGKNTIEQDVNGVEISTKLPTKNAPRFIIF